MAAGEKEAAREKRPVGRKGRSFMEYRSFLIKYAEIGVKGRNRNLFEDALVRQIRNALKRCEGEFCRPAHQRKGICGSPFRKL